MKVSKLKKFAAAEHLRTADARSEYLSIVLADGDAAEASDALRLVARAEGKIFTTGAAVAHADADILLLVAKVAHLCAELDSQAESNEQSECHSNGEAGMMGARTAEIAADLDRLEEQIARARAITIEGLKAKATAADTLRRFGYESIAGSIIRDLIMNEGSLA
jgi:hypothetical protein